MKESSIGLRQAYTVIKNAYKAKQRNPVTTASDLRSLIPVVTGKTQYTFPIIVGEDVNNYPESILLNRADAFTAVEMGIFIGKKSSTPNYEYINCKKFEIHTDALDKLDSNNYNITIKEDNKSDDGTDNNNDADSNAVIPPQ